MPDMLWEDVAASFDIDGSVKLVYAEAAGKTPGMPLIRMPRDQGRPAAIATDAAVRSQGERENRVPAGATMGPIAARWMAGGGERAGHR